MDNHLSVEDFEYEPGSLPDFSEYDLSGTHSNYVFPPLPFKTVSLFVKKIKELNFAESDFESILKKEKEYVFFCFVFYLA